jgi:hypothetical protein
MGLGFNHCAICNSAPAGRVELSGYVRPLVRSVRPSVRPLRLLGARGDGGVNSGCGSALLPMWKGVFPLQAYAIASYLSLRFL